jgi:mRNA interferase HicA
MKRRELIAHIQEYGCVLLREGGSHSIWSNPQTGREEAIPRHNEIKKFFGPLHLSQSVCAGATRRLEL